MNLEKEVKKFGLGKALKKAGYIAVASLSLMANYCLTYPDYLWRPSPPRVEHPHHPHHEKPYFPDRRHH